MSAGGSAKAFYQYALRSVDLSELNAWAPRLVERLKKSPELADVNSDQQFQGLQANVVIDRDAAGRLGIQPDAIDSTLYSSFGQRQVSIMYGAQNQYRVVLEVDPKISGRPEGARQGFRTRCGWADGAFKQHRSLRGGQYPLEC